MRERREHPDGVTFVMDDHLGGYVEGGDPNTTYPILWNVLVRDYGVKTVLDVGCGDGRGALDHFLSRGCVAVGIDGMDNGHPNVLVNDYTQCPSCLGLYTDVYRGAYLTPPGVAIAEMPSGQAGPRGQWDLVWSAEFVEHVDEQYVPNFMEDFRHGKLVLMTHAVPGQGGWHHVNCRTGDYWIGAMAAIGYQVDSDLTHLARALALQEPSIPAEFNYFGRTGLAFRRG